MGYRIRQIELEGELGQAIRVDAITQVVPLEDIQDALQVCDAREQRTRRLPAVLVVWLCIAMNLFWEVSLKLRVGTAPDPVRSGLGGTGYAPVAR